MCSKCKDQFQNAAELVKLCQESDKKLRNAYNICSVIKKELIILESDSNTPKSEHDLVNKHEPIAKLYQSSEADASFHSEDETNTTTQCKFCNKQFTTGKLPLEHKCDRPYRCDKCDFKFKSKSNLIGHRKNVHEGIFNYM